MTRRECDYCGALICGHPRYRGVSKGGPPKDHWMERIMDDAMREADVFQSPAAVDPAATISWRSPAHGVELPGGWYFWDEHGELTHGPYLTEAECRVGRESYAEGIRI